MLFSTTGLFAQDEIIEINSTNIDMPGVYDFGEINEAVYTKYIIKNNRSSAVIVSEVKTPSGFFANISDMNIAPNKKVILYVGLSPEYIDHVGAFEESIIIKTNLVMDIVVKLKGNIVE